MTRWCCWELKDSGSLCCSENPHASVAVLMQPPSTCINGAMPRKDKVPFKWAVQIHRAHRKNTSHVAEDVSCLVQKAPSRCSTQIAAPHQMPIGICFWTTLHPKDCHTTDQKYRPGLQFEAMPHTPRGHLFFSKTSQAFVGKRVPSDQIASLEFGFKTSINGFGLGKFLKSIVLTNSARSEFYAVSGRRLASC